MESAATARAVAPETHEWGASMAPRKEKLGRGLLSGYSSGAIVDGVVSNIVNTFLLFYVTTVCGLSPVLAGVAVSVGLIVDAIADPLIGSLSDGFNSRWGRRLPFMVAAMPVVLVSFVLIFSLPDWADQSALFALVVILSIVIRVSLSVFNLPYLAVGAELSDDFAERSRIMTWRWGAAMIGSLAGVSIAFGVFFSGPAGLAHRQAYTPLALTLAVIVLAGGVWAMRTVWSTRHLQHHPVRAQAPLNRRLVGELLELLRNQSFRILFISSLLFFIALGATQSLGLHANTFFWRLTSGQIQNVTIAFLIGALIGAPFCGPIVSRVEKRTAVLIGLCGWIAIQAGPVALRLAGWLPLHGQPLALLLAMTTLTGGVLMSMAAIAFSSMMADAADEHEHLFGARREGLYFAGWTLAGKAAGSVGTLLAGVLLTAISFPNGETRLHGLNVHVAQRTLDLLGFFYGPGTALLAIVGVLTLLRYRLDRATHGAIVTALRNNRAAKVESV
jgi:GPH family glycoside/pentoside/hexuronide:cation symporter